MKDERKSRVVRFLRHSMFGRLLDIAFVSSSLQQPRSQKKDSPKALTRPQVAKKTKKEPKTWSQAVSPPSGAGSSWTEVWTAWLGRMAEDRTLAGFSSLKESRGEDDEDIISLIWLSARETIVDRVAFVTGFASHKGWKTQTKAEQKFKGEGDFCEERATG